MMDWVLILGFSAAFFTTICQFPQLMRVIKTKDTKSLSLSTYVALNIGVILWVIYGFYIDDLPIILSNSFVLLMSGVILTYKIKYK